MGFNVKIYCEVITETTNKFNQINKDDIFSIYNNNDTLKNDIKNFDYIFFNGFIPNNMIDILLKSQSNIKKIFITHSDVAYSNSYIEKYNDIFYKIVCVNNYTKLKLERKLNINPEKIIKKINLMILKLIIIMK